MSQVGNNRQAQTDHPGVPAADLAGGPAAGAYPATGRRRRDSWLWLLLALVLLALLIALLVWAFSGKGDKKHPAPRPAAAPATEQLVVAGTPVALPPGSGVHVTQGQPATASNMVVQSLVSQKGMWVGQNPQHEVFLEFLAPVATAYHAGERISFSGAIDDNHPDSASLIGITSPADLALFDQEGFHIDVNPAAVHAG